VLFLRGLINCTHNNNNNNNNNNSNNNTYKMEPIKQTSMIVYSGREECVHSLFHHRREDRRIFRGQNKLSSTFDWSVAYVAHSRCVSVQGDHVYISTVVAMAWGIVLGCFWPTSYCAGAQTPAFWSQFWHRH